MGRGPNLILITSTFIIMTMMLPAVVRADVLMMRPEVEHTETYYLDQDDVIAWDWELIGDGNVDFWIEDDDGIKYVYVNDATRDAGSFETPKSGKWNVKFYNDSLDPAGATINYSIRVNPPSNGMALMVVLAIGLVIVLVFALLLLLLMMKKRR